MRQPALGCPDTLGYNYLAKVIYMSSSFRLLGGESRDFSHDFSHAEKERNACKDEKIHRLITIFIQNGP